MAELRETVAMALGDLIELAVQTWRLERWMGEYSAVRPGAMAAIRHVQRHLTELLRRAGVEYLDLTGSLYDPGLAVTVVDSEGDRPKAPGPIYITEMITPVIMRHGIVCCNGEVVTGNRLQLREGTSSDCYEVRD